MSDLNNFFSPPFVAFCSRLYGHPLSSLSCWAALEKIPRGSLPTIFTTRERSADNNWVQVPVQYYDAGLDSNIGCRITIDLDGHSQNDVFVLIPYDIVHDIVQDGIENCVDMRGIGAFSTYGLRNTFQSLLTPTAFDGSAISDSQTYAVQQPDGTIDSVAVPPDPVVEGGYSKLLESLHTAPRRRYFILAVPHL